MSESKHTAGPWTLDTVETSAGTCHRIGPFTSHGAYPPTHVCVYANNIRLHDYGNSQMDDELLANARLIAAAPDLFAAATAVIERWDAVELGKYVDARPYINALRAAVAKAKGE